MIVRTPDYYKEFICIADKCKHNCCVGGWEIDLDDTTVEYYKNMEGIFGERLKNSIVKVEDEYCFQLNDGVCPFLKGNGLCEVYQELGAEKMGRICKEFPRFLEYYGDVKELGIGLACEEVGRLLFSRASKVSFLEEKMENDTEYDTEPVENTYAQIVFDARDYVIALLQDRKEDLLGQIIKILRFSQAVQKQINANTPEKINTLMEQEILWNYEIHKEGQTCISRQDLLFDLISDFGDLIVLEKEWPKMIKEMKKHVDSCSWESDLNDFYESQLMIDVEYENFLVYLAFRYLSKTIYDNNWLGKVQFMIASFLVLRELDVITWLSNNRTYSLENRIENARIFSRQVEYSEYNMQELEDDFIFNEQYKIYNMVKLL